MVGTRRGQSARDGTDRGRPFVDWLPMTISAIVLAVAAAWTVLHEDTSTTGNGRHRSRQSGAS
ncbi:hypothetical protein [Sinomonas sp. G460-2]|uniref:hypothetical protein n=1 Tax=Sinomonas sp. G460-2 TaxID=3393464 RepID=UPI0039EEC6E1